MLPDTSIKVSNFDVSYATAVAAPTVSQSKARQTEETQYNLLPVRVRISHPLIIDSDPNCQQFAPESGSETTELRSQLKTLFPQDAQIRKLLLPLMQGEAMTMRRRLELEACLKYPHVLDLQEAFVKRELGEELTDYEDMLLRRMDGAVDFKVPQD